MAGLALVTGLSYALDSAKAVTQYAHRIWDQNSGLAQPTVYSVLQSRAGYIWLGTQDSLVRFDGARFRAVANQVGSPLHRALIRCLLEDAGGDMWAGTIGNGLVKLTRQSIAARLEPANALLGSNVFCLEHGSDDRSGSPDIWACGNSGLLHIDRGRLRLISAADGLRPGAVHATCTDASGLRWVGGEGGLAVGRGNQFHPVALPGALGQNGITALACDGARVWAGTDQGLLEFEGGFGTPPRLWTHRHGLADDDVLTLSMAAGHILWIGTTGGMSRFRDGRIDSYFTSSGLSHSLVLAFLEDREGNLWAGTKNGLDQFTDSVITPFGRAEGLSEESAGPIVQDHHGRLWVGTAHQGLNWFEDGKFRQIRRANGLLSDTVLSLAAGPGGEIWVGTPKGLNRIRNTQVIASFTSASGIHGAVQALVFDGNDTLWAGTSAGLFKRQGEVFQPARLADGQSTQGIVSLFTGQQVKLFAATAEPALYAFRPGGIVSHDSNEILRPVDAMFSDHELHETWMGTLGAGLLRWKGGVVKRIRVKDGLYDSRIYGILRDDDHHLWMASSKGIFQVSQRDLDDVADGRREFVDSLPFTSGQLRFECQSGVQPAAVRTSDGLLWFATNHGLVRINPHQLTPHPVPPLVEIESVLVDGRELAPGERDQPELPIRFFQRNLAIRYTGLSFRSPEKVRFRYILDGFDKTWTDAGDRREAFFTSLPPGSFTFRVMARSGDGLWGGAPVSLRFRVEPRIYQRKWFFPLLAAILAAATALAYRLRIRRLQQNFQIVLSERSRIARELHDTLLQGLSGLTMQLQALMTKMPSSREKVWLAEIIKDASRASAEARRSLLGLRTIPAEPVSFTQKLGVSARQAVKGRNVRLQLDVADSLPVLSAELECQLLRIAEEAFSNVITHAEATELTVSLRCEKKGLHLSIVDNGVGFAVDEQRPWGHYGLVGMAERAEEIGARLSLASKIGVGTSVTVTLPFRAGSVERRDSNSIDASLHPSK